MTAVFENFSLVGTYCPTLTEKDSPRYEHAVRLRNRWNELIDDHLSQVRENGFPLLWVGDMNTVTDPLDVSCPRRVQHLMPDFPSTTQKERDRHKQFLTEHKLVDLAERFEGKHHKNRYTWAREKKNPEKSIQMRIDYMLCSEDFLQSQHMKPTTYRNHLEQKRYGSDHSPISITLELAQTTDTTVSDLVETMIAQNSNT